MINCEKCGKNVDFTIKGVCQKCRIGNENPAHWILKQILTQMTECYKKEKYKRITVTGYSNINYHVDGYYINNMQHPAEMQDKVVTMGVCATCTRVLTYDTNITYTDIKFSVRRWTNNGLCYFRCIDPVSITSIKTFIAETLPHFHEALVELIKFAKTNQYVCAGCDKTFSNHVYGGKYFAGKYCSPCWEIYKKKNHRICQICKHPNYKCYC